jgi:hypothetical protein
MYDADSSVILFQGEYGFLVNSLWIAPLFGEQDKGS